jgi:two-component system chemotaxis response regulator CheY
MKTLVVEDDFTCRVLLAELLSPYGQCDVAVDGEEAIAAVQGSLTAGKPYDLVCLDIKMPKLDGRAALKKIRTLEEAAGCWPGNGAARVVMTTSVSDPANIMKAFKDQCDGYLVKPVTEQALQDALAKVQLPG